MQFQKLNYMNHYIDQLMSYLGQLLMMDCLGCGSYHVQNIGLCRRCEEQALSKYASSLAIDDDIKINSHDTHTAVVSPQNLQVKSLYNWIPGESHTLSAYAYLMKSPLSQSLWRQQAHRFLTAKSLRSLSKQGLSSYVFIPIPSSKNRRHSEFFATSLSEILGGVVIPLLVVNHEKTNLEQKRKNRHQRSQIQFKLNEVFTTLDLSQSVVILVDDIITTGSSCRNAYKALKPLNIVAENTQLWTLFRRLKSPTENKISSC